jgi:hypothetical protein
LSEAASVESIVLFDLISEFITRSIHLWLPWRCPVKDALVFYLCRKMTAVRLLENSAELESWFAACRFVCTGSSDA